MAEPAYASASVRNSGPIFGVLHDEIRHCGALLEIGSGTAHHALTFAKQLPRLTWQTSDLDECHPWITKNIGDANIDNVLPPLSLDVRDAELPAASYDVVYSCNTAHIMSRSAADEMLRLAGHVLVDGGMFCYYGPFKRDGRFTTPSNAAFDASLRSRDADMGIRDLGEFDRVAAEAKLQRQRIFAMPTNNLFVVWARRTRIN